MGTYFEDGEERQRKLGNVDSQETASKPPEYWEAQGGETNWAEAINNQQNAELQKKSAELDGEVGQFDNLVMAANQQRAITAHQRDVAFLSLFKSAAGSGTGVSDPALNQAGGAALGIPNFCGMRMINKGPAAGNFAVYQLAKDQNGNVRSNPAMLVSPDMMAGMAKRLRNNGYNNRDVQAMSDCAWNIGKQMYGLTDAQMSERGFQNPNDPIEVGGVTMGNGGPQAAPASARLGTDGWEATSGETAKPGARPRHGGISVFSTNGSNYRIGTADEGFERQDFSGDHPANQHPNGEWKVVSYGPSATNDGGKDKTQQRVYENTKTGERVTVKDGETPPWRKDTQQNNSGNWHENVARINAESREKIAKGNNEAKVTVATVGADGKIKSAETQAGALLKKTQMQVESYAKKNLSNERIAAARNDAQKWIAELKSKTSLQGAELSAKSKERIAAAHDEAQKAIAEGKSEDWLMGKQLEYEAKIEAIEASKMNSSAKNKLIERLSAERNAVTLEVAKMRQEVEEDKIDLGWEKEKNAQGNAEVKLSQEQQKIDNDKAQKEADRQLKRDLADLRARNRHAESHGTSTPSRIREINSELTALEKVIANGSPEDRKNAKARISALSDELSSGDKATIKKSDNIGNEKLPEYDENASYSAGDKFIRDGKTYQVGDDGKAHLVK